MQLKSCGICFPRKKQKTTVLGVNLSYSWTKPFVAYLPWHSMAGGEGRGECFHVAAGCVTEKKSLQTSRVMCVKPSLDTPQKQSRVGPRVPCTRSGHSPSMPEEHPQPCVVALEWKRPQFCCSRSLPVARIRQ